MTLPHRLRYLLLALAGVALLAIGWVISSRRLRALTIALELARAELAAERARRRRQAELERERLDARDDHAAELAAARDDADATRAEIQDAAARPGGLAARVNEVFGLEE